MLRSRVSWKDPSDDRFTVGAMSFRSSYIAAERPATMMRSGWAASISSRSASKRVPALIASSATKSERYSGTESSGAPTAGSPPRVPQVSSDAMSKITTFFGFFGTSTETSS